MNLGSFLTRNKDTMIWTILKLMLKLSAVTWSISAKIGAAEVNILAKALQIPKIVEFNIVGLRI